VSHCRRFSVAFGQKNDARMRHMAHSRRSLLTPSDEKRFLVSLDVDDLMADLHADD
jgi:hypothetical protein